MTIYSKVTRYRKTRLALGAIFLLSTIVLVGVLLFTPGQRAPVSAEIPSHGGSTAAAPAPGPTMDTFVAGASLVSSVVSLLGFALTSALAWRKDKREALAAQLELARKELELQKLRSEMAASAADRDACT